MAVSIKSHDARTLSDELARALQSDPADPVLSSAGTIALEHIVDGVCWKESSLTGESCPSSDGIDLYKIRMGKRGSARVRGRMGMLADPPEGYCWVLVDAVVRLPGNRTPRESIVEVTIEPDWRPKRRYDETPLVVERSLKGSVYDIPRAM